jgi:endonuclease/exonuclease/phosphatase family metal-dependent hydrolase
MRIATFNTLGFSSDAARDTDERKRAIVEGLVESRVDLAMLQEIETIFGQSGPIAHCSELPFRRDPVYGNNFRVVYGHQRNGNIDGVGIASRLPVFDEHFGPLPSQILGKAYLVVRVMIQDIPVTFLTFHLAPPAVGLMVTQYGATAEQQSEARRRQLSVLAGVVRSFDARWPVVVGADFNMETDDSDYVNWRNGLALCEVLPDSAEHRRKTFATHRSPSYDVSRDHRVDHLLYRQGTDATIRETGSGLLFDTPFRPPAEFFYGYLSDHCAIYLDFDLLLGDSRTP